MRITTRILACASALALAAPAAAQTADAVDAPEVATWQELTSPSVRFIQRDNQGNVLFDSAGLDAAPGATDPEVAEAIARADGETTGATDMREMGGDEMVSLRLGTLPPRAGEAAARETAQADAAEAMPGAQAAAEAAPSQPVTGDESLMAAIEGVQPEGTFQTNSGMQFDMEEFAREMFEQGYRRGYVSGLTEMRTRAVRQLQGEREAFAQQRAAFERQAAQQRRAMNEVLDSQAAQRAPQMQRQSDGSTMIVLPRGMTPRQFLEGLAAQR